MSSWLQKQRKAELASLAEEAGLTGYGSMLKEELVFALDDHLKENSSRLNGHSAFAEYYRNGSPVKRSRAPAPSDQDIEPRSTRPRRRATRIKEEVDSDENTSPLAKIPTEARAVATRTPRSVQRVAEQIPLPPSPAVVTTAIENQTAVVRNRLGEAWTKSGIMEKVQAVREALSSVVGVESAVILVEAYYLQKQVMPWEYAFDVSLGFSGASSLPVSFPNLFALLTAEFWGPSLLWASTSLFIPLLFAYFFNFTLQSSSSDDASQPAYPTDPLSFNIAKALISYLVYSQGVSFAGLVGPDAATAVKLALPGETNGVLIGAGIGALASLYTAALKR